MNVLCWSFLYLNDNGKVTFDGPPSQLDHMEKIQEHYTSVKHYLGEPLLLDAAQCGSYAHQLRN
jgi:hypothetical protein